MNQQHEIVKTELRKDRQGRDFLYVFAPVLVPNFLDLQKQWVSKETIEEASFTFMEKYQDAGWRHKALLAKSAVTIVENFISKSEMTFGSRTFPQGTWFQGFLIFSKELIQQVQRGELKGFSIGGKADSMIQHLPPT